MHKTLLLFRLLAMTGSLFLSFCLKGMAQVADTMSYKDRSDFLFQPLNKSQIPSGILYDRVFPLASLPRFTGSSGADTTSTDHFYQAYYEIYNAAYNTSGIKTPLQLRQSVINNYSGNAYPIALMYYNYHTIDTMAISKNLMTVQGGQVYDVAGRTSSPYINNNTFLGTVLLAGEKTHLFVGNNTFTLDPNFFLTNKGANINYCVIDFGDGTGPKTISVNNSVTINYTTEGTKYISMTAYMTNGTQVSAKAKVKLKHQYTATNIQYSRALYGCQTIKQIEITGRPFDPSQYEIPRGGQETWKGQGTAYIYFSDASCADQRIRKPVIFLEAVLKPKTEG